MDERVAYVLTSLAIGAAIGGLTNALAIRMLFRPRRPWRVAGVRLPFTPGLIPKRRDDVARALGKMVADYLITPEGIVGRLQEASFREKWAGALVGRLERLAAEGATIGEAVERLAGSDWEPRLVHAARKLLEAWWSAAGVAERAPAEWIPGWNEQRRAALAETLAEAFAGAVRDMLRSSEGRALLRRFVAESYGRFGLLGSLAGALFDADKAAHALGGWLESRLDKADVRKAVVAAVERRLAEWENRTVGDWLEQLTGLPADEAFRRWLHSAEIPEQAVRRLRSVRVERLLAAFRITAGDGGMRAADAVGRFVRMFGEQAEAFIRDLDLAGLVSEQVARFPAERIERLILDIAGRELRAITWLGALLGGIVGFAQGLLATAGRFF